METIGDTCEKFVISYEQNKKNLECRVRSSMYPFKKFFKHNKAGKNHLTSQQVVMKEPIKVGMTSSYIELGEMTNQLF